jgi:putative ABC transport system permease protein
VNFLALTPWDIAIAASLLVVNAALSIWLQLGVERRLAIAGLRMVVQLSLVALVLESLFTTVSPWLTGAVVLAMVLFAGWEARARQERRLKGWWSYGIGTGAMLLAGTVVTCFALFTQLQPEPWYHPRYAVPLLGMILGNCMTGVAIGLNVLQQRVGRERAAIETMLALGYDRREALKPLVREAVRAGMIPIINTMAVTGLVALPGMMTGQILAGVAPIEAAKYQMLVIFLIAGGTAMGVALAVLAGAARLTDERHRLRLDRLTPAA